MKKKPTKKKEVQEYGAVEGAILRKRIVEMAEDMGDEEMLLADGFDAAILGVTEGMSPIVVYSWDECIEILIHRDDMTMEDAIEHMSFNVTGAYVGPRTPIFVRSL
jgi:hypothetical protein